MPSVICVAALGGVRGYNLGTVTSFCHLIEALEAAPADREFVTHWIAEDEQERLTFGEFRARAHQQASVLQEEGVAAGDRVVILMPQGIPAMTVFAGAMMLGAVPAFLAYPNFKVEASKYRSGLAGVTANLAAKLIVIDEDFPQELLGHVSLGEHSRLLRSCAVDALAKPGLPAPELDSDSLAFIQHSAGTTGLQKGVALTHAEVLRQLAHLAEALAIDGSRDRIYSWLPLYHDMGLIACFMLPLVAHVPLVMQSPLDWVMRPETMLQIVSEHKCTLAWMPNFGLQFVPRRTPPDRWARYDLSSLRALINCSEPVRAKSMLEFELAFSAVGLRSGALQSCYAMAENVFAVTQSAIDQASGPAQVWADGAAFRDGHRVTHVEEGTPGAVCFTSSGQLLAGNRVVIMAESGAHSKDGHVGEILLKSDSLFTGYYNRPDLTAEAMVDGWYRTGDLGFFLDGELFVIGRKKDLIIVGGTNLYPQDVEEVVAGHPAIRDGRVIALGVYNPDLGTEDVCVVAEIEQRGHHSDTADIEREVRTLVTEALGITIRHLYLKPPKWIVKSTAGKPARAATLAKLLKEHPELNFEAGGVRP